jgi:hypothetical protein
VATRRRSEKVIKKGRFAHARLAVHDERAAATRAHIALEPVEHGALGAPSDQLTVRIHG